MTFLDKLADMSITIFKLYPSPNKMEKTEMLEYFGLV